MQKACSWRIAICDQHLSAQAPLATPLSPETKKCANEKLQRVSAVAPVFGLQFGGAADFLIHIKYVYHILHVPCDASLTIFYI